MKNSIFKDVQVNKIYRDYLQINQNIRIEYIEQFLSNIDETIAKDFEAIINYNSGKEREIIKIKLEVLLFSFIGLRKKEFYKKLELSNKANQITEDIDEYYENFVFNMSEIRNSLKNIFKIYYEILIEKNQKNDLREIYTIYRTIMMCIINTLPDSYRNELFDTYNFKVLKQELEVLKSYENYTPTIRSITDIKDIEKNLIKYIEEKYDVDLYDFTKEMERKRV